MKQAIEQKTVRRASLVWSVFFHASPLLLSLLLVGCGDTKGENTKGKNLSVDNSDDTEEEETTTSPKKKTKKPNPKQKPKNEPADLAEKDSEDETTPIWYSSPKPKQRFVKKGNIWWDTKKQILWTEEQSYSSYKDAERYCKNLYPGRWQLPYVFWLEGVTQHGKWQLPGTMYEGDL